MPTYTVDSRPHRTDYAVKLFESGLALYTFEVCKKARSSNLLPYYSGESLGFIAESGIIHPFYVYPAPEVLYSGIPGILKYHVSAYSRWTDNSIVKTKLVAGKMAVVFSYENITHDIVSVVKEYPIFLTQIFQSKIIKSGEKLQFIYPEINFQYLSGENLKITIQQFSVGNQNFDNEESAVQYATENGGNVENTSYLSLQKSLKDFQGIQLLNENNYDGNFGPADPLRNSIPISINQNNFGEYSEVEIVQSSEVSVGTIEANLIYDFGIFWRKIVNPS